jgi:serine/threonine protein kinase
MTEREIFLAATDLANPAERAAYLDKACASDAALRVRVEALLRSHQDAGRFLASPVVASPNLDATGAFVPSDPGSVDVPASAATTETRSLENQSGEYGPGLSTKMFDDKRTAASRERSTAVALGTVIADRYTLVEVIGEGGMGSVYLAEQSEPVKRQVALKLIKTGMDSKAVLARFDAERQALALMDHPNIARIYDGGVTPSGLPFFVMELVKGVPLTKYCDRQRLTVDARLQLFVLVCQAVQHAHQKGIIHRDLKPGNVLVTEVDGRPTPKVIDFGVAKATEQKLTDMSFSDVGAVVGTPTYMSPEQADPTSMDIDTRTDIYALGVMLYELLTGSPPIDSKQFRRGAILEMLRMVREVEPEKPSTKVSTSIALPSIASNRDIEPTQLKRALRGDLDWIVMKALEKDRNRRYDTANGFAADILRHLAHEPVLAAPPSRAYRTRKFVRKHRGPVLAAAVVLLALLASVAVSVTAAVLIWQEQKKTEAERVKATENADTAIKVVRDLSRYVSLVELSGGQAVSDQQRRTALDTALVSYERLLALHPDDADVRANVARTHRYRANLSRLLNETGEAEKSYREASRNYSELAAAHPEESSHRKDVALTSRDFALFVKTLGRLRESTEILDVSIRVYEELVSESPNDTANQRMLAMMLLDRAELDYLLGGYVDTECRARRSAELYARLAEMPAANPEPLDPMFRGMAEFRQATALRELGRIDDALAVHDRAVERLGGLAKLSATRDYLHQYHLAQAERAWTLARVPGRQAAGVAELDSAIAGWEKLAKQFPQVPAYQRGQGLGTLYRGRLKLLLGRRDAAAEDLSAAAKVFEGLVGKHQDIPVYRSSLGQTYMALGQIAADPQSATEWYRKAREMLEGAVKRSPENAQDRKALMELDALTKPLKQ